MTETHQFKFGHDTLGHILQDRRVAVPIYQRSYAWKIDQIEEYWTDIKDLIRTENNEYFIGTIVMSAKGAAQKGYSAIIDGQQRLATTAMMYSAIRAEFQERGDQKRGDILHRKYLADEDEHSAKEKPRLHLNSEDDPFFYALIVEGRTPTTLNPKKESHERLAKGYSQIREYISKEAENAGNRWQSHLLAWADFMAKRLRVVTVDVPTEADAFLVFETLNDRGADLTIADLLKNYLFRKSGDGIETVRDRWMKCLGSLEISAENELFTTFIRHSWSSRHGSTRERELYKRIKENVASDAQAIQASEDLLEAARHYSAILNSEHSFWSDLGPTAKANIETLTTLGLEQMRPLLMALMQHFATAELKKALRALVHWGVRGLIVGGIGGGKTEKYYCNAAVRVRRGDTKTKDQLFDALKDIIPLDQEFKAAFATSRATKSRLARYYLISLESSHKNESEPELVPNANQEEVNLEHVLPKTYSGSEWPAFTSDEHKTFVYRIGNLCLLQKGPNGRIGNKKFSEKKPVLAASNLELTSQIGGNSDWTAGEIEERQQELAELALRTWPRR